MRKLTFLLLAFPLFFACSDEFEEGDSFFHVFNDETAQAKFHPESMIPTGNGYFLLSAKGEWTPHAIWMDKSGNLLATWEAPPGVIHPASGITSINGMPHFVCMDQVTLQPILFAASAPGQVSEIARLPNGQYPLSFGSTPTGNPILVTYERQARRTLFHILDASGALVNSKGFNNLQEIDEVVLAHIKRQKVYPFFLGTLPTGGYFFNGFVNYSYSLLILDEGLNQQAIYQGTQYKGGVAALLPFGQSWAMHRFLHNDMYLNFPATIAPAGTFTAQDLGGNPKFQWAPGTAVRFANVTLDGANYLLIGYSGTDAKIHVQVVDASGQALGSFDLGHGAPARLADMAVDADNGVLLFGNFTVAGQFQRPGLFKLDVDELRTLAGLEEDDSSP